MDYNAIGLVSGIEIHQQARHPDQLFCGCPTVVRPFEEHDGEFCRYLRATASELGEIDRAAEEEMKEVRRFRYLAYDTTCLVENDDEPPSPLNEEALAVTLEVARTFGMTPIEQVHVMRKLVIDGSNTSGFQRTALVAVGGVLPNGGVVESILPGGGGGPARGGRLLLPRPARHPARGRSRPRPASTRPRRSATRPRTSGWSSARPERSSAGSGRSGRT